jgi:NodT family efflux transporter outer membrane factor (OMF) lipoprotein
MRPPLRAALPVAPALLALLALLLAGCAAHVAPRPVSTLQVAADWRSHIGPASTAAPLERDWWSAFGDPAMSTLVSAALAHNGDLRLARERVQEYRARAALADANLLPTLSASIGPTRARSLNAFGVPHVTNVVQGQFQASYEADVWGRLDRLSEVAAASLRAEQAAVDAAALSVAGSVATGYLNLRGLDAQLALAEATLVLRQQSLELARKQFEIGYSSRLEMLQAQSEYNTTAETVPPLQRSISEQENALSLLTGVNPGAIARGRPLAELSAPPVPAGLPSDLLGRRPDIYRAQQNVLALDAGLLAARDQMLPSFKLTAVAGGQATSFSQFLNAPTALWSVGGSVLAPLFEGGRIQAQTDVAAAQRNQALITYDSVVRNAFAEADNGLTAVFRLNQQAVQNDARRASAAETLRIAHNRYSNGYASYLDELDAQRTLYSADVARLQLKTRILVAAVDLYRAMGGGWSGVGTAAGE